MTIAEELHSELQLARARLGVESLSNGELQAALGRTQVQRGHSVVELDPAGSIVINEELLKRDLHDLRNCTFASTAALAHRHSR